MTPLGLSVGSNVYILSFLGHQKHSERTLAEKDFEKIPILARIAQNRATVGCIGPAGGVLGASLGPPGAISDPTGPLSVF